MKLALVNPYSSNIEIMHKCPPYGILSLMSFMKGKFQDSLDISYHDDFLSKNIKQELKENAPDIIGISANTPTIKRAYELADYFRKETNSIVILGGRHPSACPEESLSHADYVVCGEGENALFQLVTGIMKNGSYPEKIVSVPVIDDLNSIAPLPWDKMDMSYYLEGENTIGAIVGFDKVGRSIGLLTSRGCPFRCIFCYNSTRSSKVRYLSAQRVIAEVEYMINKHKVDSVFFFDDEFLSNKERIREICQLIKEKGLNFQWSCQARADLVDEETLQLIKEAGCRQVGYGFESGSPRILKFLKGSPASIAKNQQAIKLTKKAGIRVFGNFILGTPTEKLPDLLKTFFFAFNNPIDIVGPSVATAYPGTKLWDYCIENKIIDPKNISYDKLSTHKNTYYLNKKYMNIVVFKILYYINLLLVVLFKKGYSFNEIAKLIKRKLLYAND